jgi:hypothetical protein
LTSCIEYAILLIIVAKQHILSRDFFMQKGLFLKPNDIISPDFIRRYYMELGERIKKLRKEMKLTQDEFASKLNSL